MSNQSLINFKDIEGPVYTGRDRGERLRKTLKIDELDNTQESIEVVIPANTYSISSSFFLGLFGPSVIKSGSKEEFFKHYNFKTTDFLLRVIDGHALRALQERNLFSKQ
jgi:hypothetical protein